MTNMGKKENKQINCTQKKARLNMKTSDTSAERAALGQQQQKKSSEEKPAKPSEVSASIIISTLVERAN